MEGTNWNKLSYFGNQDLQIQENCERTREKINICKSKHKHFLMSILQKHVIEINIPNCIYLFFEIFK